MTNNGIFMARNFLKWHEMGFLWHEMEGKRFERLVKFERLVGVENFQPLQKVKTLQPLLEPIEPFELFFKNGKCL